MAGQQVGSISIKVTPDTTGFRKELQGELEAIETALKVTIPAVLDFDANGIREKVNAATAGLDQTVKVKFDVDKMPKIPRIPGGKGGFGGGGGGGFGGLGIQNIAVIAAVASLAAPALALISGILVTLPGIIAGVLTPIAAIALGMDGIKKAAEVLKGPLDNLKASLSQAFQDRLTPIFDKLGQSMPLLAGPLKTVANGLSDVAKSFVDTVTSGPGMAAIQSTISNIGKAIGDAAPGIGNFTSGLLTLADKVSAKFPGLSKWFNEAGDSFQKWVTKITTPAGGLGQAAAGLTPLDKGLTSLKDTVKEIMNLGGDLLGQGFAFLSDPNFGAGMKTFVADIKDLVTNVLPGLGKFFTDLSGAMHEVNTTVDKLPSFLKNGGKDPNAPKPEVIPKTKGWGFPGVKKDSPLGDLVDSNFGFKGLNDAIKNWSDGVLSGNPFGIIGDKLQEVFGFGMAKASAEAPAQAGQVGQSLGQGLQQGAQTGLATLGPTIQAEIAAATLPLQQIPAQIQTVFSGIGAAVTGSMATVVGAVVGAGQQIQSAFTAALAQLPGIAVQAFGALAGVAQGTMAQVVAAIASGGQQAVAAVQTMGQQIVAALQQAASGARAAGAQVGAGMAQGIRESTGPAVAAAQALAAAVTAAAQTKLGIKSPSKVFTEIGAQTAQGLQNGLDGGFQGVVDRATALAQAITDAVNNGLTGVDGSALNDQLKKQIDEIGLQSDQLKVDLNGTTDKGKKDEIKGQRSQLQTLRDQLNLQQDQLGFSDKYGNSLKKQDDVLGQSLSKMVDIGSGFATANLKQFESDIGISGNGAISTLADIGIGWGTSMLSKLASGGMGGNTSIHVNSLDEAMAAKQNITNKQALQYAQR